ncbi:hypothetical protein [Thermoactinomyces vulgaris]|uniref:hypothetical protein n=1 Tax=Thermoactinomyces vulgaris TaxID=2026 RepID=UPI0011078857|nr:hypothetical protein [Thermoactinomyces vulgaris]QCV55516.1 hypothetical protein FA954_07775 [Thermoactinomyces vulgaris]
MKKWFLIFISCVLVFSFSFFGYSDWTSANEKLNPEIKVDENNLRISFNSVGDKVTIQKDDDQEKEIKIKKGIKATLDSTSNQFEMTNLAVFPMM